MIVYFDCYSGISGDMILGALADAGVAADALEREVAGLGLGGYKLRFDRVERQGISGTQATVEMDRGVAQPHRHLSDIVAILDGSSLAPRVRERSKAVFQLLAEAESKVHGLPVEAVHFHEVGAIDALVDVVGAVAGLELLGATKVFASPLPTGGGSVETAHGLLPVPAPATMEILARAGAPIRPLEVEAELVTPTGAAILAALASFQQPEMRLRGVGYGFGTRTLPWPNALRLWVGEEVASGLPEADTFVIEANLDDMTPESLGFAMERLFAAGALDVFFTPIQMKKNRPAVMLSVIAPLGLERDLAAAVIRETTTLGVRIGRTARMVADRRIESLETPLGTIRVKVKSFDGQVSCAPEYEDCAAIARERGIGILEVMRVAAERCGDLLKRGQSLDT